MTSRTPPHPNSYAIPDSPVFAGEYPFSVDPPAALDKLRRFLDAGITSFIDLTEEGELDPYERVLREEAARRGVEVEYRRLPIPDMGVPSRERMAEILDAIDDACRRGRTVYVHCWGGVGRTGTVVGCHLVRRGMRGDVALREVAALFATMSPEKRRANPRSPEVEAQRRFVREWLDGSSPDETTDDPGGGDRVR